MRIDVHTLKLVCDYDETAAISKQVFAGDHRKLSQFDVKAFVQSNEATNGLGAWITSPVDGIVSPMLVGYMLYKFENELVSLEQFAVLPGFRRRGVFRKMLEMLANAAKRRRKAMVATVYETDVDAQLALRQCKFLLSYTLTPERKTVRKAADRVERDRYTFEFLLPEACQEAAR